MRFTRSGAALVAGLLSLGLAAPTLAQGAPQSPPLTLEASRRLIAAAQAQARTMGLRVVIAVVDQGGHLIASERMDGTQTASVEIAQAKARSAAAFRRPTRELASWVAGGDVGLMALPGFLPVEGGIPIVIAGQVVGAVGVSGATARQDGEIAQSGLAVLDAPPGR